MIVLSICEAVIANNGEVVQPPNSQVQVKQPAPQQSTSVPNQSDPAVSVNNQAPIGQDSNSAAGQQQTTTQQPVEQKPFDWKKILTPLAIGGAAIGTLGLAHAMYTGHSLNPSHLLPKLSPGAAGLAPSGDAETTPVDETPAENNETAESLKQHMKVSKPLVQTSVPMEGPISTPTVFRLAYPQLGAGNSSRLSLMIDPRTGHGFNFQYNPMAFRNGFHRYW